MREAQTKATKSLKQRLQNGLGKLVWRVNEDLQWFQGSNASPQAEPKRRNLCLVLARGLYTESWQSYTIRSQKALRKVLNHKTQPNQIAYIGPWQEQQRQVLTVTLNAEAVPLLDKAWLVFPESLVLSAAFAHGLYQITSIKQSYFLLKNTQRWQTLPCSKLVSDAHKAKLALGCPEQTSVQQLTEHQLAELCARGVAQLGSHYWAQGAQKLQARGPQQLPWRQIGLSLTVIGALYLAVSSSYLLIKQQLIEHRLTEVTPQVSVLLDAQTELQTATASLAQLQQSFVTDTNANNLWQIVVLLSESQATLSYISLDGDALVIGGAVTDALQLLKNLHALPQVHSAEFATPLRDGRGGQQFRIAVQLTQSNGAQS